MRRRAWAFAAIAIATGCHAIAGLDDDRQLGASVSGSAATSGGGGAGGGAATSTATGAGGGACVSVTYPDPPVGGDDGGAVELVAAIRTVDFGDIAGDALGVDLDGKCTCAPDGPSCLAPSFVKDANCDGPGGRDNGTAKVFEYLAVFFGGEQFSSAYFSGGAEIGDWSIVYRVRGYNGTPDDGQVQLDMFPTRGFADLPTKPSWNGDDAWPIPETALTDGVSLDKARFTDAKAYVAGGVLVASLPTSAISLGSGESNLSLDLTAGLLMARIEADAAGYHLRGGLIAARWKLVDVFRSLGSFRDTDGAPICTDFPLYGAVKSKLCGYADIYSALGKPTDECDSISLGIAFEAHPAKLGPIIAGATTTPGCAPEIDPTTDTCE